MDNKDIGGGDHSPEMQSALKKFEDACILLDNEQAKLTDLEKRRKKLQEDLERLRNEILVEKSHVRSVVEERVEDESAELREECNPIAQRSDEMDDMTQTNEQHSTLIDANFKQDL